MSRHVLLLRGINVGGRRLSMPDLAQALSDNGFDDVQTYLASGNVVVTSSLAADSTTRKVHRIIADAFGMDVDVLAVPPARLRQILGDCPFADGNGAQVHLFVHRGKLTVGHRQLLQDKRSGQERLAFADGHFWADFPHGVHGSALATAISRIDGLVATGRNLNTVRKLDQRFG